jgi:hypothetical protein
MASRWEAANHENEHAEDEESETENKTWPARSGSRYGRSARQLVFARIQEGISAYRRVHRLVLFRATPFVQQDCRHAVPDSLGRSPFGAGNHQRQTRCCAQTGVRGGRFGVIESGACGRNSRVKGAKKLGVRLGNWLTAEEARTLWQLPNAETLKGKRDRAVLATLLGCGLRRRELAELTFDYLQKREDHWAIVDLVGKAGHVRTVPVRTGSNT